MIAELALTAVVATEPSPPQPMSRPLVVRSVEALRRYMVRCEAREGIVLVTESEGDLVAACVRVRFQPVEVPE